MRFPTVGELFNNVGITAVGGGAATAAQIAWFPAPYNTALTSNPNLNPETAEGWELAAEHFLENGVWQYPDPNPNPNVYGGCSSFSIFDAKVVYRVARQWSASVGIDNIGNAKYFTLYPYAQRTFFAGLKFDY